MLEEVRKIYAKNHLALLKQSLGFRRQRLTAGGAVPVERCQWSGAGGSVLVERCRWRGAGGAVPVERCRWSGTCGAVPVERCR